MLSRSACRLELLAREARFATPGSPFVTILAEMIVTVIVNHLNALASFIILVVIIVVITVVITSDIDVVITVVIIPVGLFWRCPRIGNRPVKYSFGSDSVISKKKSS